jgi:ABC-type glutathione transport system ATPase component
MTPLLEVDSLSVCAGETGSVPISGVSFQLGERERLAVVGRSGAGKSVLATAVAGLLRPPLRIDAGSIRWGGEKSIFYLFQDPGSALSPCIRIRDQVRRAGSHQAPDDALAEVGLAQASQLFPHELSGGMRQRVLIAMALVRRPMLLIADEPTTGLDPVTQSEVLDSLDRLLDRTRAALLFITHDVRAAARMCPRALVLDRGRVAACSKWNRLATDCSPGSELVRVVRSLGE